MAKHSAQRTQLCPIATPLASEKLCKKLFKLTKKASKEKAIKRGVKEVGKFIRKGDRGLLVIAGDISPLDVISHLPVLCEDSSIPYVFVPSKSELGLASGTKRPTSCILVDPKSEFSAREKYEKLLKEVKKLTSSKKE